MNEYAMNQHLSPASAAADVYAAVTLLYSAVNSSKGQTIIKLVITERFEPSLIYTHRSYNSDHFSVYSYLPLPVHLLDRGTPVFLSGF